MNRSIDGIGSRITPDIVFTRARVAVFVDGCFWHGCPIHGTQAASNAAYWSEKIAANRERDRRQTDTLIRAGWRTVRIWEHEALEEAADRVVALLADPDRHHAPASLKGVQ